MDLEINSKRVARVLAAIICCLTLAHVVGKIMTIYLGHNYCYGLVPLFDLGDERNIPTFYSASTIFLCAILLAIVQVSQIKSGTADYFWGFLCLVFLFLSADEMFTIHEQLTPVMESYFHVTQHHYDFYYLWIVPYLIGAGIIAGISLRTLIRLPARFRYLFILAGAVYIGGAAGMEMLGSYTPHNLYHPARVIISMLEDVMELIGIAIFLYALLNYLEYSSVRITFSHHQANGNNSQ